MTGFIWICHLGAFEILKKGGIVVWVGGHAGYVPWVLCQEKE